MSISDIGFANGAIMACCMQLGLQDDLTVISVTNKWRWTIEFTQDPSKPDVGLNMIKLERLLQERLKRPIDLRVEAESDKNRRKQRNVLGKPPTAP